MAESVSSSSRFNGVVVEEMRLRHEAWSVEPHAKISNATFKLSSTSHTDLDLTREMFNSNKDGRFDRKAETRTE